jgi:tetratricopeptide (TPR) repeat protein
MVGLSLTKVPRLSPICAGKTSQGSSHHQRKPSNHNRALSAPIPMQQEPKASPAPARSDATTTARSRSRRRSVLGRFRVDLQSRSTVLLTTLLALLVPASLLAVGTVHVTTLLYVAPIALAAGALALFVEDRPTRLTTLPPLICFALSLYSFIQSVPMPQHVLRSLSPVALQTWVDAYNLVKEPATRWASISVDPGASRVEALKWLSYAAVFLAAARLARERGAQWGALSVIGAALLGGLLSLAHGLAGAKEWLGLYKPQMANPPWSLAPLLNPNNFAGYLNLALFTGIGLLFARKPLVARWLVGLAVVVLTALVILTASRGGVLALVIGFGISGVAFRSQQRRALARGDFAFPSWLPLAAMAVAAVALAVIGATDVVWQQLFDETTSKLRIIEYSRPVIRDHLWTGVGRGAFETAFSAYRKVPGNTIAQYAENFVVQWIVEWGLPVALVGLLTLAWCMRPQRLGFGRNAIPTGICIAIGALLLQNLVDLATELFSVGVAVAVLLGTLSGGAEHFAEQRLKERALRKPPTPASDIPRRISSRASFLLATASLIAGLSIHCAVAKTARPDTIDERWELAKDLRQTLGKPPDSPDAVSLRRRISAALLRHPADPYIPLVGALSARESGRNTLAWLNQALRRDPLSARPHLLLAETLVTRGALNQALAELRRTTELEPELRGEVCDRAVRWTARIEDLLRIVPDGQQGIPQLNALAQRFYGSTEAAQKRAELLSMSLGRDSLDVQTNSICAGDLFAALVAHSGVCEDGGRRDCEERLRHHVAVVVKNAKESQTPAMLTAQLLAYDGKRDEAERWLGERCHRLPDPLSCGAARVSYALALEDHGRFDTAAAEYVAAACSSPTACSQAHTWLGNLELSRANPLAALARFERSAQESPSSDGWLRVAELATQLGRIGRAETALAAARRLGSTDAAARIETRLQDLRRTQLLQGSQAASPLPRVKL